MAVNVGDYVLLRPEDVPASGAEAFTYAEVATIQPATVGLLAVGVQPPKRYVVQKGLAEDRKVDAGDATGS
jgi:hypothetical protein